MTTPDNRALWELVEKWRTPIGEPHVAAQRREACANELAAILERPVVVGDIPTSALSSSSKHMRKAAEHLRLMAKKGVPKHMRETAESIAKSLDVSVNMNSKSKSQSVAGNVEGWMPIDTAPKDRMIMLGRHAEEDSQGISLPGFWNEAVEDGVDYMGNDEGFVDCMFQTFYCGRSFGQPSYQNAGFQPTHWRELHDAPQIASRDAVVSELDWDAIPEEPRERRMFDNGAKVFNFSPHQMVLHNLRIFWMQAPEGGSYKAQLAIMANEIAALESMGRGNS